MRFRNCILKMSFMFKTLKCSFFSGSVSRYLLDSQTVEETEVEPLKDKISEQTRDLLFSHELSLHQKEESVTPSCLLEGVAFVSQEEQPETLESFANVDKIIATTLQDLDSPEMQPENVEGAEIVPFEDMAKDVADVDGSLPKNAEKEAKIGVASLELEPETIEEMKLESSEPVSIKVDEVLQTPPSDQPEDQLKVIEKLTVGNEPMEVSDAVIKDENTVEESKVKPETEPDVKADSSLEESVAPAQLLEEKAEPEKAESEPKEENDDTSLEQKDEPLRQREILKPEQIPEGGPEEIVEPILEDKSYPARQLEQLSEPEFPCQEELSSEVPLPEDIREADGDIESAKDDIPSDKIIEEMNENLQSMTQELANFPEDRYSPSLLVQGVAFTEFETIKDLNNSAREVLGSSNVIYNVDETSDIPGDDEILQNQENLDEPQKAPFKIPENKLESSDVLGSSQPVVEIPETEDFQKPDIVEKTADDQIFITEQPNIVEEPERERFLGAESIDLNPEQDSKLIEDEDLEKVERNFQELQKSYLSADKLPILGQDLEVLEEEGPLEEADKPKDDSTSRFLWAAKSEFKIEDELEPAHDPEEILSEKLEVPESANVRRRGMAAIETIVGSQEVIEVEPEEDVDESLVESITDDSSQQKRGLRALEIRSSVETLLEVKDIDFEEPKQEDVQTKRQSQLIASEVVFKQSLPGEETEPTATDDLKRIALEISPLKDITLQNIKEINKKFYHLSVKRIKQQGEVITEYRRYGIDAPEVQNVQPSPEYFLANPEQYVELTRQDNSSNGEVLKTVRYYKHDDPELLKFLRQSGVTKVSDLAGMTKQIEEPGSLITRFDVSNFLKGILEYYLNDNIEYDVLVKYASVDAESNESAEMRCYVSTDAEVKVLNPNELPDTKGTAVPFEDTYYQTSLMFVLKNGKAVHAKRWTDKNDELFASLLRLEFQMRPSVDKIPSNLQKTRNIDMENDFLMKYMPNEFDQFEPCQALIEISEVQSVRVSEIALESEDSFMQTNVDVYSQTGPGEQTQITRHSFFTQAPEVVAITQKNLVFKQKGEVKTLGSLLEVKKTSLDDQGRVVTNTSQLINPDEDVMSSDDVKPLRSLLSNWKCLSPRVRSVEDLDKDGFLHTCNVSECPNIPLEYSEMSLKFSETNRFSLDETFDRNGRGERILMSQSDTRKESFAVSKTYKSILHKVLINKTTATYPERIIELSSTTTLNINIETDDGRRFKYKFMDGKVFSQEHLPVKEEPTISSDVILGEGFTIPRKSRAAESVKSTSPTKRRYQKVKRKILRVVSPETGSKMTLEEALRSNIIDSEMYKTLQERSTGSKKPKIFDPSTNSEMSMEDAQKAGILFPQITVVEPSVSAKLSKGQDEEREKEEPVREIQIPEEKETASELLSPSSVVATRPVVLVHPKKELLANLVKRVTLIDPITEEKISLEEGRRRGLLDEATYREMKMKERVETGVPITDEEYQQMKENDGKLTSFQPTRLSSAV